MSKKAVTITKYNNRKLYIEAKNPLGLDGGYITSIDIETILKEGFDINFKDKKNEMTEVDLLLMVAHQKEKSNRCKDVDFLNRIIRGGGLIEYAYGLESGKSKGFIAPVKKDHDPEARYGL